MKCSLCEKEIEKYDLFLNHLEIDEKHSVEICFECSDKILKWQQKVFTKLFPTSGLKKRLGDKK